MSCYEYVVYRLPILVYEVIILQGTLPMGIIWNCHGYLSVCLSVGLSIGLSVDKKLVRRCFLKMFNVPPKLAGIVLMICFACAFLFHPKRYSPFST